MFYFGTRVLIKLIIRVLDNVKKYCELDYAKFKESIDKIFSENIAFFIILLILCVCLLKLEIEDKVIELNISPLFIANKKTLSPEANDDESEPLHYSVLDLKEHRFIIFLLHISFIFLEIVENVLNFKLRFTERKISNLNFKKEINLNNSFTILNVEPIWRAGSGLKNQFGTSHSITSSIKNINFVGREISILSLLTWLCGNAECTLPSDRRLLSNFVKIAKIYKQFCIRPLRIVFLRIKCFIIDFKFNPSITEVINLEFWRLPTTDNITSRNNASMSNFGGGFRWKSEYPWYIIETTEILDFYANFFLKCRSNFYEICRKRENLQGFYGIQMYTFACSKLQLWPKGLSMSVHFVTVILVFEILVNNCLGQSKTKQKLSTFERSSLTMIINVLLLWPELLVIKSMTIIALNNT
ncbi:hypothetical protein AGLY_014109 [Aphis glycines]|uniref:Uncharacterized protein n=1 Tax=Aphis glycines TaxID=307491 RepID=A0A6G0T681_APHGL|nr:hypothetical protein AGLY_014109 [Aphis glycines]